MSFKRGAESASPDYDFEHHVRTDAEPVRELLEAPRVDQEFKDLVAKYAKSRRRTLTEQGLPELAAMYDFLDEFGY